jgi:glycosyltransferase involved in cell wall biosynthesis
MHERIKPIRVLMVTNIYPKDSNPGQGSFVKSQIDSLIREGVDVEVLSIDAKASRLNYLRAVKKIWLASFSGRFDLIHAHYGFSGIISRLQFKLPVLMSFCGDDVLGTPNEKGRRSLSSMTYVLLNQIFSFLYQCIIVKSDEMKNKLLYSKNIHVIPNGVDFNLFHPMNNKDAKRILALDYHKKYIFFPSDPSNPRKCYPIIEKAVSNLKKKDKNLELLILHSKPHQLVPLFMNACEALVLASYWEGSPNVIKEAMSCNLPIVSVDVGDVKKIIQNCLGCHVVGRNSKEIEGALEQVLQDKKRTNGRGLVNHLEIQTTARKIIRIYLSLIRS